MIVPGPELFLILLIMIVVFGLGKLPQISKTLARMRLNYEKGVATDMIEITPEEEPENGKSSSEVVGKNSD